MTSIAAQEIPEPTPEERAALLDLRDALAGLKAGATSETIQNVVYEMAGENRSWIKPGK